MKKISYFVSIYLLAAILIFTSIFFTISFRPFYEQGYKKYHIYERFGKEKTWAMTENILDYFKGTEDLDKEYFTEKERMHLYDVKVLLERLLTIYLLHLIIFLLLTLYYKNKSSLHLFPGIFFWSGVCILSVIAISGLLYFFTGFAFLFQKFHEVFFVSNYAFDPGSSNLKGMYPDGFFFDMGRNIVLIILGEAILFMLVGIFSRKKTGSVKLK